VFGHRCREYAPHRTNENTIAALREVGAKSLGCESDTPRIAGDDGAPAQGASVIYHDLNQLTRVTSKASRAAAGIPTDATIADVTRDEFTLLRTKGGEPLPTLRQFIRYASRHRIQVLVELKGIPAQPEQVARWVRKYKGEAFVSFYQKPKDVRGPRPCDLSGAAAFIEAGSRVGLKEDAECPWSPERLAADGFAFVAVKMSSLRRATVRAAHRAGLLIGNQNAGKPRHWAQLVRTGADFSVAPHPGRMKRWLLN
jgi:hypothetical protein